MRIITIKITITCKNIINILFIIINRFSSIKNLFNRNNNEDMNVNQNIYNNSLTHPTNLNSLFNIFEDFNNTANRHNIGFNDDSMDMFKERVDNIDDVFNYMFQINNALNNSFFNNSYNDANRHTFIANTKNNERPKSYSDNKIYDV